MLGALDSYVIRGELKLWGSALCVEPFPFALGYLAKGNRLE